MGKVKNSVTESDLIVSILVHLTTGCKIKNRFFGGVAFPSHQKIGFPPNEVQIA
jgi:hypothetical protein